MHKVYEKDVEKSERRREWEELVVQWRASGLSGSAFCKEVGLRYQDLSHWSYRLAREQRSHSLIAPVSKRPRVTEDTDENEALPTFYEISVPTVRTKAEPITVTHDNGYSVRVNHETDLTFLREILSIVGGLR